MVNRSYHDFDMAIMDRGDGRYDVRVLDSPSGQARCEFSLPFSDLELENFLLRIGRSRRGVRRLESPEAQAARAFGERLSKAVFTGDVGVAWQRSVDDAEREGKGLRLRLRLTDAEVLTEVPWEFLCVPSSEQHLVLSSWTPLVRYLDLPRSPRPLTVNPPLRMLAMVSSPSDYPALDTDSEWSKLDESLEPLEAAGIVEMTRLDNATLQELQRALRRTEYHVFHFIGHGGFDESASEGVLVLEDDGGRSRHVTAHELATILTDARSIRLAVLNSCEGARAGGADPFGGTAPTLVAGGIPAVVAMQFEITDRAAIVFAHELYAAISDGYPVDAAVAEARRAIFGAGNDVEWGTPVLYMRTDDGRLFDFVPSAEPPQPSETAPADDAAEPGPTNQLDVERVVDVRDTPSTDSVEAADRDDVDQVAVPAALADEESVEFDLPESESAQPVESAVAVETEEPETSITVDIERIDPEPPVAAAAPATDIDVPQAADADADIGVNAVVGDEVDVDETQEVVATDPPAAVAQESMPSVEPSRPMPEPVETGPVSTRTVSSRTMAGIGAAAAAVLLVVTQLGGDTPEDGGTTIATAATTAATVAPVLDGDTVVAVRSPGITIDGDLTDWSDVAVAAVADHRIAGQTPAGERLGNDSVASFKITYDDQGLYVFAEVPDDGYFNQNVGDQIWRGDAIDLNISTVAPESASATPGADDFQITLTPADANGAPAHALFQGVGASTFRSATTDSAITLAGVADSIYRVEAFIPWSVLGLSGPPGGDMAALFAVFDNDGEVDGKQPLQAVVLANIDGAGFQDPNTWGRLTLVP